MTARERISRLGAVVLTLAAAVGAVWLMRRGARLVVETTGLGGEADYADAQPDRRPAAKVYDLAEMVPETLEFNVAGLELHSISTVLDRPIELAIRQDEQVAESMGWELLDMPIVYSFSQEFRNEHLYRTRNGDVKRRTYYELRGGRTCREELTIPAEHCPRLTGDESFETMVGLSSERLRDAMPEVLKGVVQGDVFQTRRIRRGAGTAFHVSAISGFDELTERSRIFMAFTRSGWVGERKGELVFRKANLMAFARAMRRDDGKGSLTVYRFSDDEALEDVPVGDLNKEGETGK